MKESALKSAEFLAELDALYGADKVARQSVRYADLYAEHVSLYDSEPCFVSAPGRIEICGNHTDHNHGKVLCAALTVDTLACVSRADGFVEVKSKGYPAFKVDLSDLSVREEDKGTSAALVRGVAEWFVSHGYAIGGFVANTTSDVFKGAGVSSSAAFEVLIGKIFSIEFNGDKVTDVELAYAAHHAETVHFGKPCGLLDQMAIALGGVSYIDFKDPTSPDIKTVAADFSKMGIVLVNTGGDHSNLTEHYASIRAEMEAVANACGGNCLREVCEQDFYSRIKEISLKVSKRAILRAIHFYEENKRVDRAFDALSNGDKEAFFRAENESGMSSYTMLQNCYVPGSSDQPIPFALTLAGKAGAGAKRVHGGGFAGTVLAFCDVEQTDNLAGAMQAVFGKESVYVLSARPCGAKRIG